MLGALGLDLSLAGLQAANAKAAKDLLLLLLRQLADTQPPLPQDRYRPLHTFASACLRSQGVLSTEGMTAEKERKGYAVRRFSHAM